LGPIFESFDGTGGWMRTPCFWQGEWTSWSPCP
jgi:hypothetical protein